MTREQIPNIGRTSTFFVACIVRTQGGKTYVYICQCYCKCRYIYLLGEKNEVLKNLRFTKLRENNVNFK